MPNFYGSRPAASQMPITPPDSGSGYGYASIHYSQDPYAPHSQPRHDNAYDYQQQGYMQANTAPAPPAYQYSQSNYQSANSLPPISSCYEYYEPYEPIGAPILPPLRIHDRMPFADDYQRRLQQEQQDAVAREQQRQAAKEEKATGGVSAKLDYDMERMTDFVTDATMTMYALHCSPHICVADVDVTRSFHHKMQSQPSFRKWVHQVLSATRLPSSTIMLSLHYLNDRVAHFPESVSSSENQIYRLLAVALILGSKFLDDNTFINRSWSDVTAIKVSELNTLEAKWLEQISWCLHVDPENPNGLQAWLRAWKQYAAEQDAVKQQPARLSPLDTNVHRNSPSHRDRYSPYPTPYSATSTRTFEPGSSSRSSQAGSTAYSSDMWSSSSQQNYEEYYGRNNGYSNMLLEMDKYTSRISDERARQSTYTYPQTAHPSYYHQQPYTATWDSAWNAAHRYDCRCTACAWQSSYRGYSMPQAYASQAVMG
jgi:hypothetical protein